MNLTIVIQGPTKFYREILNNTCDNFNYIWSTWSSEPKENLEEIKKTKVKLITQDLPSNMGYGNINAQTLSTSLGILESKTEYVMKIRSDMIFSNLPELISSFDKNKRLSFLCYHNFQGGYPVDYICFGSKIEMENYWNYFQKEDSSIFAEMQLLENYLKNNNNSGKNFESLSEIFHFFLGSLNESNEIIWLKNNLHLSSYKEDPLYKY